MAASRPTVYYGLYSDALGISAVYTDLGEVAAATDDDGAGTPYSICSSFASYEEARYAALCSNMLPGLSRP
jgi:hypothetical protein